MSKIKRRERDAILRSLRAGVVPGIGLQHIQVGRSAEVQALLQDLEAIGDGSAAVRFVIGRYGSGKSFFLNLIRTMALKQRFVVVQADVTPDRRLQASAGQARTLYAELLKNLATKSRPNGGALASVVERWVGEVDHEVRSGGGGDVSAAIHERLAPLRDHVGGFDFANVLTQYVEAFHAGDDLKIDAVLRWLRGEYTSKTDARKDLGVRRIVDDGSIYDFLKLLASFVRLAGYRGLLVNLDELGVLSLRLNHAQARQRNYEVILRIVNDCLQGDTQGIGFVFAGVPEFLEDRRRGMASYEALATRLAENSFATGDLRDLSGPVVRLENLSEEELFVLLKRILIVYDSDREDAPTLPDEALGRFMVHCSEQLGSEYYQTPRDSVKRFVHLLSILEQNPGTSWESAMGQAVPDDASPRDEPESSEQPVDDLVDFRI